MMGNLYTLSGVDRQLAHLWIHKLKERTALTLHNTHQLMGVGGFAGRDDRVQTGDQLFSAVDGVGTKLLMAKTEDDFYHLGIDLVAACTNDLAVYGAQPLFFLDYLSLSEYTWHFLDAFLEGMVFACLKTHCAFLGGETAQMPILQADNGPIRDLCGFAVGVRSSIFSTIGEQAVLPGDMVIALSSSGFHANGFSLIRLLLKRGGINDDSYRVNNIVLHEHLMKPTLLYTPLVQSLVRRTTVHAMANITGGGLYENIERVLLGHLEYVSDLSQYVLPDVVSFFQNYFLLSNDEIWSTWNCGIGFVLIIPEMSYSIAQELSEEYGLTTSCIGYIREKAC